MSARHPRSICGNSLCQHQQLIRNVKTVEMPDAECPDQSARNLKVAAVSECQSKVGLFYFGPTSSHGCVTRAMAGKCVSGRVCVL